MKVEIFDTALRDRPGTCYFDVKEEIEHMQKKYVIKDIKTIMTYPNGFDVMLAIFYEAPSILQQKTFNEFSEDDEVNEFLESHDVIQVDHRPDCCTVVTYKRGVSKDE